MSGPLYLSSTGITDTFAVFYIPQTGGNIHVVFITGKLFLSVYRAYLSTLTLPEGTPYLVLPLHLPHVTKYIYIIIIIPDLLLAYSTEQFRLT